MAAAGIDPRRITFDAGNIRPSRIVKPVAIIPLAGTETTIYDNAGSFDFLVQSLWVSNITGSAVTLTLWAYTSGGSASDAVAIYKGFSVAANSGPVPVCSLSGIRIRLRPGMLLTGLGSTGAALNVGGWGVEVLGGDE